MRREFRGRFLEASLHGLIFTLIKQMTVVLHFNKAFHHEFYHSRIFTYSATVPTTPVESDHLNNVQKLFTNHQT